ncbi:MAG: TIGR03085 family metal-binding protein [Acidimicrobiia bacterium]
MTSSVPGAALPLDASERRALCDLALELGPDAPTLCEGWSTADLVAHLVVRERKPRAMPGILVGGRLGEITERAMEAVRAGGFEAAVARVRTGPPLGPGRVPGVRTLLNLNEYFVHHEDVRRANGRARRTDVAEVEDALWAIQRRSARFLLRRAKALGVELARPGGESFTARKRTPWVRLTGAPGELALYLFGRSAVADVEISGEPAAVEQFRSVRLGF